MILQDTKGQEMRKKLFGQINFSKANKELAEIYLDMDQPEDTELLEKAEHQDLALQMPRYMWKDENYPEWLRKKKRTEELGRYVRFITAVGGGSVWNLMISADLSSRLSDLDYFLSFLTGEHAEEQKTAIRAGMCVRQLRGFWPADAKILCRWGTEDPNIFLRAMEYCYTPVVSGRWGYTRMLLVAMYLHHVQPGTAPDLVKGLEESLIASLSEMAAFERHELACIQSYARTAEEDTPFPHRILSIYNERKSGIDTRFFSGCAFLAVKHSRRFEIILRLTAAVDSRYQGKNLMLETCMEIAEEDWFDARMEEIEEMLPIEDETYILLCLELGYTKAVERMAIRYPDAVRRAGAAAESGLYRELVEIIQRTPSELSEELAGTYRETYCEKAATEIVSRVYPGRGDAKGYLLGNCCADALEPYLKEWGNDYYEEKETHQKLAYIKKLAPDMYRRVLVLQGLRQMAGYLACYPVFEEEKVTWKGEELLLDRRQLDGLLQVFAEEKVSVRCQAEALSGISVSLTSRQKKEQFLNQCADAFMERIKGPDQSFWEEGMTETVRTGREQACCLCLKVLAQTGGRKHKELFLSCASGGTKKVRAELLSICREYREWMPEILELLSSKKVKEREFAVMLLEEWGDSSSLEAVREALEREKNKKLAVSLQELAEELEREAERGDAVLAGRTKCAEERLAAEIFKGSRKKKVDWVQNLTLPKVHRQDKEAVSPEYMYAILTAYADMTVPGISEDAKILAAPLIPEEIADYMKALYEGWLAAGAEAKKRWVLYAAAVHGGPDMIPVLYGQLKDWAEHSRGAMAAEAVRAMALNGSPEALHLTDQMSRKFKFRQVKNAAGEALKQAASILGISREELEDRLVPEGSELSKKEWKDALSSQKLRLEQVFFRMRFWEAEKWKELFTGHSLMHTFAQGLIWGIYEDRVLKETFRYMGDGTFNTAEEETYTFPEDGQISLVHPLELTEEELSAWKGQLADYEIVQPFAQLDRPVFRPAEEEQGKLAVARFENREVNGRSLSGRLLKMGWIRGEVMDAAFFKNYYRSDGQIGAELTFSGSSIGCEDEDVTIENLYFYRLSQEEPGSGIHRAFQKENRFPPAESDSRYFSELILQIAKAVGDE